MPFIEKVLIENEVVLAPANQHRQRREPMQTVGDFFHQIEAAILWGERNVLHKTQDGDAISPGIVRSKIAVSHLVRHRLADAVAHGPAAEGVQAANQQRTNPRCAAQPKRPRQALALRHRKRRRVENDQSFDALGMAMRERHADHAAPIVQDQREAVAQLQMIEQRFQVRNALPQRVFIAGIIRLIGQTAADMVRHNGAILVAQAEDEIAIVERPGRIAVQHHQRLALAFVEIVIV
jgi:hypothetical protein